MAEIGAGEKIKIPSPAEAWIGIILGIDPLQLKGLSGNTVYALYEHPKAGNVMIDEDALRARGSTKYGMGFKNKRFDVFMNAYEGKGERPSCLHPILRNFYNKGLEAKAKWQSEN